MVETFKWINLIGKLLQATQENKITWSISEPPSTLNSYGEKVEQVYEAQYLDQRFRLYEYMYKNPVDDDPDQYVWSSEVRLEFIDIMGRSLFVVPKVNGLYDLLNAARFQSAGVDQFLKKIVSM